MLASLKTLTNQKIVPKATKNLCSGFPSLSLEVYLQCTFVAGFRNNFQNQQAFLPTLRARELGFDFFYLKLIFIS